MLEKSRIWNNQCQFPVTLSHTFLKRLASQRRPALHFVHHFLRGMFTVFAPGTGTNQENSGTVTFYVIINSISCRDRKELYTSIFPYCTVISGSYSTHTGFFYFVMNQNRIIRMSYTELHLRLIRECFPIHRIDRLKSHLFFIQQSRNILYCYISQTYFFYIQLFHFFLLGVSCKQGENTKQSY